MIETIEAIARSPLVEMYNIGITVNSARRRNQYINWNPTWPHFVILRSGLSCVSALKIEKSLYELIKSNRRSALFRKYRSDTREGGHTPSLGGLPRDNSRPYDLYVAWGNVGDN